MVVARPSAGGTFAETLIALTVVLAVSAGTSMMWTERAHRTLLADAQSEMQVLATALEQYRVEWTAYPPCNTFGLSALNTSAGHLSPRDIVLERLSTPIALLGQPLRDDPFSPIGVRSVSSHASLPGVLFGIDTAVRANVLIRYTSWDGQGRAVVPGDLGAFGAGLEARSWCLQSAGPDRGAFAMGGILSNFASGETCDLIYDPTNGLVSYGAIFRVGGEMSDGYGRGFTQGIQAHQSPLGFDLSGLELR